MSRNFRRVGDRYVGRLRPHEVDVLRSVVADVQRFMAEDVEANDVTARLFPDPSFDPAVSADLRGLIEDDLRAGKREAARTLLATLPDDGNVALTPDEAEAWLTALNDLRLAVGTAIGVTEEWEGDDEDPTANVYEWLGFLQDSLVDALSAGIGR